MTLSFSGLKPSPIDIKTANSHNRSKSPSTPKAWPDREGTTRSEESSNSTTTQQPAGDQYVSQPSDSRPAFKLPSPTTPKAMNLNEMKSKKG